MRTTGNSFLRRLRAGDQQVGLFSTVADATLLELLAGSWLDWVLIDTEHAPTDPAGVLDRLRVLDGSGVGVLVRPTSADQQLVKRLLDVGARSLLFPSISSAAEAQRAVALTRYPPEGVRGVSTTTRAAGYGRDTGYLARASEEVCVIVQVETREGLEGLDGIATTPGVDAVFIGPSDLAASLGHLGDTQHPEVRAAVDDALARLRRLGVPAGCLTLRADEARRYLDAGVQVLAVATDTSLVWRGASALRTDLGLQTDEG